MLNLTQQTEAVAAAMAGLSSAAMKAGEQAAAMWRAFNTPEMQAAMRWVKLKDARRERYLRRYRRRSTSAQ
jgi:hypothetical protein